MNEIEDLNRKHKKSIVDAQWRTVLNQMEKDVHLTEEGLNKIKAFLKVFKPSK